MENESNSEVVVITGASRGLGRSFAETFSQRGASLALLARDQDNLRDVIDKLRTTAISISCDVTHFAQVEESFRLVYENFGRVDCVVANAGGQSIASSAANLPISKWQEIIDLNLTGVYFTARAAYKYLRKSRAGKLIIVSSAMAKFPTSHVCAYTAAKAGLEGLTRALCVEWASDNICVNAIAPGYIDSAGSRKVPKKLRDYAVNRTALKRPGLDIEVANLVAFLAGDSCNYVTGQVWSIDGGYGLG